MKVLSENKITREEIDTRLGKAQINGLLGKGKSGYSYLASVNNEKYVLKRMHYEHCPYYSFGDSNKVVVEVKAYYKLRKFGFLIPKLITFDPGENYLLKEYIEGSTAMELIVEDALTENIIEQLFTISNLAKRNSINIDYFPNNFVLHENKLFYVDYELNPYLQEWDLENWGIYYWANSEGVNKYLSEGNILAINETVDSGIPIKDNLQSKVDYWITKFSS